MFLIDDAQFGDNFNKWKQREDVSADLCQEVQRMGPQFVFQFLTNVRHRLQPYWTLILTLETIDPCSPREVSLSPHVTGCFGFVSSGWHEQ